MSTKIKYKDTVITIASGQTATLHTTDEKLTEDISIVFGSKGSITYKGNTVEVEAGKTATLLCSGKMFTTDIVVYVPESDDTINTLLADTDGRIIADKDGIILTIR